MGFFTRKSFDDIRQEYAQLLVNYGYLNSVYDLVISIVEKKEWEPRSNEYYTTYEVYATKLDKNSEVSLDMIDPPEDTDLGQLIDLVEAKWKNIEWNIGRGLTVKHAMQNLYCNLKEILEPDEEIEDCFS